jgi:trimethylamine--corrinoid protein Co-methyltransferase
MTSPTQDIVSIPTKYQQRLLTDIQVQKLKEGTLTLLEEVGVHFPSERALGIFSDFGAKVDHKTQMVYLPPDLVEKAISTAPRAFTLGGREKRFDLYLDGQNSYLCTDGCGVHVVDPETGVMRASRKTDVARMARISDALPLVSFFWPLVSAQDHGRTAPLHECHAGLTNTLKHVRGGTTVLPGLAQYIVEMATVVRGSEKELRKRSPICANICTIAPLAHDKDGIETALVYASAGIPTSFMAMPTMGSTAPATPLGALATGDAEVVSAMVLIQLAYPGTPVFHSEITSLMDPRTGGYIGELPLPTSWLAVQIAHEVWKVPSLGGGSTASDTPLNGWMSGAEGGMGAAQIPLVGAEITGFLGLLDSAMILTPEKIILDYEIIESVVDTFFGFEFSEEDLALDVIRDVGPQSHFLKQKHTRTHMRDFRYSRILRQKSAAGANQDPIDAAREEFNRLDQNHFPEPLPETVLKELDKIMAAADQQAAMSE